MTHASCHRPHIAWTLYFCVLFNVFVCGLGHGQMAGLELNGVGGQFCSAMGNPGPALNADFSDQAAAGGLSTFMCPLCSAVSLGIALLFCLGWMLRRQRPPRLGASSAARRHRVVPGLRSTPGHLLWADSPWRPQQAVALSRPPAIAARSLWRRLPDAVR